MLLQILLSQVSCPSSIVMLNVFVVRFFFHVQTHAHTYCYYACFPGILHRSQFQRKKYYYTVLPPAPSPVTHSIASQVLSESFIGMHLKRIAWCGILRKILLSTCYRPFHNLSKKVRMKNDVSFARTITTSLWIGLRQHMCGFY